MTTGYFNSAQLAVLYKELELECAEFEREHGHVTAAQHNLIAARIMAAARDNPPPKAPLEVIGPHGT